MKYGAVLPPPIEDDFSNSFGYRSVVQKLKEWRNFLLLVVLPTVAFATYQYLIAADQFETTSDFLVKTGENSQAPMSSFGQILGIGGQSQSQSEILSVPVYMGSHEVVAILGKQINLLKIFRRPEADIFSKMADPSPEPEKLLKYYRGKVNVRYNSDTGIMHMSVRSFRPSDSLKITNALLSLGEQKINLMNQRRYRDALGSAQMQLERAEKNAADIQREITIFRQINQDVDPELSGQAQIKLVAELNSKLASLRAQLISVGVAVSRESPQYRALQNQVSALEAETASQARKMGGANAAIASTLGKYEALKIRQELAAKNYEAAAVGLQRAAEQAQKQQLYFITIVSPNLPVRSLYPKREELILTLFCFLLISYGIGWLIYAGMREHEA